MVCIHSPIFFNSLEELFQERGFSKDSEHKIDQVRLKTEIREISFLLLNYSFIRYNFEFISQNVTTFTMEFTGNIDKPTLDKVLQDLLWEKALVNSRGDKQEIYRLKVRFTV